MPIEATFGLLDKRRKKYSSEQFFEDLENHILSDEEPVIELFFREPLQSSDAKGIIFPDDRPFTLDFVEDRVCKKPIICGNTQPTCFTGGLDLQNIQFESRASFVNAQFYKKIEFSGSRFDSIISFDFAKFSNQTEVNFTDCNFEDEISFRNAELRGQVNFYHTRFCKELIFYETNIHQFINFSLVRIHNVLFSDIKVRDDGFIYFEGLPIENKNLILIENIDLNKSNVAVPFYFYSLYAITNEPCILFKRIVRSHDSAIAYFDKCYLEKNSVRFVDCDLRRINSLVVSSDKATDNISYRNCLLAENSLSINTFSIPLLEKDFKICSLDDFSLLPQDKYIINEIYQYLQEDIEKLHFKPIELQALNLYNELAIAFKNSFSNDFSTIDSHKLIKNIEVLQIKLTKEMDKNIAKLVFLPGIHGVSEDTKKGFKDKADKLKIALNKNFIDLSHEERKKVLEQFNLQFINQNFLCLKEKYAFLKSECEKNGDKQTAIHFHFCQLYWHGREKKDLWNKMYLFTCAYGLSWQRPLVLWLYLLLFFFASYSLILLDKNNLLNLLISSSTNCYCKLIAFCCYLNTEVLSSILKQSDALERAFLLSLSSSTAGFDPTKILSIDSEEKIDGGTVWIYVLFWFQKVIQLFLLFEVGAAIRNKVKR